MSSHKHIDRICLVITLLTLGLTLLFINGRALGLRPMTGSELQDGSSLFSTVDLYDSDTYRDATEIVLQGQDAQIVGGGAYFHEGRVVISSGGAYRLSGTLESGPVLVDTDRSSTVFLLFDGVTLRCPDDAALWVEQAGKVVLSLAEGSENRIEGSASRSDEAAQARRDGAIFCRDDLSINGPGSLSITAGYRHGIDAHDDLILTGGTIRISAPGDALHVNDSLRLREAELELEAADKGLSQQQPGGQIVLESGSLTVKSADDAIHGAGEFVMKGGRAVLTSGDDAVRAETAFQLSGGSLLISDCREGVESAVLRVSGGELQLRCRVNGLSAALPRDREDLVGQRPLIELSGGSVVVICPDTTHADGLDSKGDIFITGGALLVGMSDSKGTRALNWARDQGGVCRINGGSVVCLDSGAMTGRPDRSSGQCSLLCGLGAARAAGTTVVLEDADGRELLRAEAPCSFSCALLSSPRLEKGGHYRLLLDGLVREIALEDTVTVQGVFPE